ncbi:MAG: imidazole glycerol phosphate synthase subunit HisF [Bacteroidota bacterium]
MTTDSPRLGAEADTLRTLKRRVIPCLDVKAGRVVKGVHFVGLRDMGDPVELAARYEREGADEIVFLDIAASAENRATALHMVRRTAAALSIPFTLGGGLRTLDDVYAFLDAGADKVALNTRAVEEPALVDACAKQFGSQCVVVAVDVQPDDPAHLGTEAGRPEALPRYGVYIRGGREKTDLEGRQWAAELADRGAGEILLTCIHRDGTGEGFDTAFTGALARTLPCQVIASGGAATPKHLFDAFEAGADAVLAATMFHSGEYEVGAVKQYLDRRGIPVRLA